MKKLFGSKLGVLWFVLMLLCFLYSVMVAMVGSGNLSFVIWISGTIFFAICFYLSRKGRWKKIPSKIRAVILVVIGAGLAIFLACQVAIFSHYFDKGAPDLDYIVVLGAQMRDHGPSIIYKYRLQKAKEYLDANEDTICITTGGKGFNENISEGEGGKEYLVSLGIPEDRIIVEGLSADTVQNIENAYALIQEDIEEKAAKGDTIAAEKSENPAGVRIGVVTNGFHVFRGVHIAKHVTGYEACGIAAFMQLRFLPNNLVRESLGIIRDLLKGDLL